jgi:predicted DNA-binding antitoxin AbrB/MazE fold protein
MSIEAFYNGEVFVPEDPVDLSIGQKVQVDFSSAECGPSERRPRTSPTC